VEQVKAARNAKKSKVGSATAAPADLVLGLHDPGLTTMLRAGLGGLAASLRAIARTQNPDHQWPAPVPLGPGEAVVEPSRITLRWGGDPEATLRALFEGSFEIRNGLIHLPGAWDPSRAWTIQLGAALQNGLKRTFLQHGQTTKKEGAARPHGFEIDDRTITVTYQPYASFKHQGVWKDVLKGLKSGSVELAGWANPGAVGRHNAFDVTEWSYGPAEALCGIFAIVGCVSLGITQSGGAGALVILEPADLVRFAEVRPRLTPDKLEDAHVAGASDAVLHVHLVLRMEQLARDRSGIAAVHGLTLRATPWASQQKSRIATVSPTSIHERTLDEYDIVARTLPVKLRVTRGKDTGEGEEGTGYFAVASALRGFIAENLAKGRRWFTGFATAVTLEKQPRFLHRYRTMKDNLGALRTEERSGLIAMTDKLEEAEKHFVRSVHVALRRRFGAIAKECEGNLATMKNRFQGERDKWRMAFAGSKTHEQIRGALADLWSRAGANRELQAHWEELLPLLRPEHWQTARDLGLVALASYQSAVETADDEENNETSGETEA
jgi:CRISPR-associated protein Cas8a1/Csx13